MDRDNFTSFMTAIMTARVKRGQTLHSHYRGDKVFQVHYFHFGALSDLLHEFSNPTQVLQSTA
jgi:hypothetical protein